MSEQLWLRLPVTKSINMQRPAVYRFFPPQAIKSTGTLIIETVERLCWAFQSLFGASLVCSNGSSNQRTKVVG